MKADVLDSGGGRRWLILLAGVALSGLLHLALAVTVSSIPVRVDDEPVWLEMAVIAEPPPPPPPPEPEPEPEAPEPEPEPPKPKAVAEQPPIDLKDIPPPPPPDAPPPPPERKVRRVTQGLSANSFAPGSGTGFDARAGTTTAARAGETMSLDEATEFATVPYTSVASPPKIRANPPIQVPQAVIDAELVGRVELEVVISPEGRVVGAEIVSSLGAIADQACIAHATANTRWAPYTQDGVALAVKGVPFSCRFEKLED